MEFTYEPGRLFHETDGIVDAEILFPEILGGAVWSIDHTYVDPELRDKALQVKCWQKSLIVQQRLMYN
ncbi:hypothetical protein ABU186_07110 [Weissella paramesenteroides]